MLSRREFLGELRFIDDAHDLHPKTLVGLKRLIEVVRDGNVSLCR